MNIKQFNFLHFMSPVSISDWHCEHPWQQQIPAARCWSQCQISLLLAWGHHLEIMAWLSTPECQNDHLLIQMNKFTFCQMAKWTNPVSEVPQHLIGTYTAYQIKGLIQRVLMSYQPTLAYSGLKCICQSQLQSYFQLASQVLSREKRYLLNSAA